MLEMLKKRMRGVKTSHILLGATLLPMAWMNGIAATLFIVASYGVNYFKFEKWPIKRDYSLYNFGFFLKLYDELSNDKRLITAVFFGLLSTASYMFISSLLAVNYIQLIGVIATSFIGSYLGYKIGPSISKMLFPSLYQLDQLHENLIPETPVRGWILQSNDTLLLKLKISKPPEGFDPNIKDRANQSILWKAIRYLDVEIIEKLIDMGADVKDHSLLDAAVGNAIWCELETCMEYGMVGYDPRPQNMADSLKIIQLLVENGADINNPDPLTGNTFLHKACANRIMYEVSKLLIELGADLSRQNECGEVAINSSLCKPRDPMRELIIDRCRTVIQNHHEIRSLKDLSSNALYQSLKGKETYQNKPLHTFLPSEIMQYYKLTASRENRIGKLSIIDFCKNHYKLYIDLAAEDTARAVP